VGWVALGLVLPRIPHRNGRPEAEVLAVGHGLAIVIQAGEETILYDCGRMHDPSVGRRIVAPALWARGVSRLDAVILSHADADHYNGLPDLLERFPIAEIRIPPGFAGPANPGAIQLLETVRARGVPVRTITEGDQWETAGARLSVWHPPESFSPSSSDNARSIVLDIESSDRHLLLTGDLEQEGLTRLLDRPAFPLDALLAPHHGGRSANPESLYTWARPELVVVSQRPPAVGTRDFLDTLEVRGIPLFRTWQRGAIRLRWEPGRLAVGGFLDAEAEPRDTKPLDRSPAPSTISWASPWLRGVIGLAGFVLGMGGCVALGIGMRKRTRAGEAVQEP
jgi:competence protein ComEC